MDYSARPPRGRQVAPTKAEIHDALAGIRQAATAGNLSAMVALVSMAKADELAETLKALRDDLRDLSLTVQAESMFRRSAQINTDFHAACDKLKADLFTGLDEAAKS